MVYANSCVGPTVSPVLRPRRSPEASRSSVTARPSAVRAGPALVVKFHLKIQRVSFSYLARIGEESVPRRGVRFFPVGFANPGSEIPEDRKRNQTPIREHGLAKGERGG